MKQVNPVLCYVWQHIMWFLGLAQISLGYLAALDGVLPPATIKYLLAGSGLITALITYIKANPQPSETKI